jgi:hypothetical protein
MLNEDEAMLANKRHTKTVNQIQSTRNVTQYCSCYTCALFMYNLRAKLLTYNVEPALKCSLETFQMLSKCIYKGLDVMVHQPRILLTMIT